MGLMLSKTAINKRLVFWGRLVMP